MILMKRFIRSLVLLAAALALLLAAAQRGRAAVVDSMLIFPLQHDHVHASTLVRLPDGERRKVDSADVSVRRA